MASRKDVHPSKNRRLKGKSNSKSPHRTRKLSVEEARSVAASVDKSTLTEETSRISNTKLSKFESTKLSNSSEKESQPLQDDSTQLKDITNDYNGGKWNGSKHRFVMTDITVTVLGMTGLLAETEIKQQTKLQRAKSTMKRLKLKGSSRGSPKSVVTSKQYSIYDEGFKEQDVKHEVTKEYIHPTIALATFSRNIFNSATTISTHIPSLPLEKPIKLSPTIEGYNASWPFTNLGISKEEVSRSSVTLTRVLQRGDISKIEPIVENEEANDIQSVSTFIPELVELKVGLIREGEMITLGTTTIVVSETTDCLALTLPLQQYYPKAEDNNTVKAPSSLQFTPGSRNGENRFYNPFMRKINHATSPYFTKDPCKKYILDENATIRILLNVVPHGNIDIMEMISETRAKEIENEKKKTEVLKSSVFKEELHNIEVGTDNVATLWKIAPHDYYEVVEYKPPEEYKREEESAGPQNEIKSKPENKEDNLMKTKDETPDTKTDDHRVPSLPPVLNQSNIDGLDPCNCFNPALTDAEDLLITEELLKEFENEDNYFEDDETTQYTRNLNYSDSADDMDENKGIYCASFDDSKTYSTYDSKFISLDSSKGTSVVVGEGPSKNVDMKSVRRARETLRRFADRIGVDPEDLV